MIVFFLAFYLILKKKQAAKNFNEIYMIIIFVDNHI